MKVIETEPNLSLWGRHVAYFTFILSLFILYLYFRSDALFRARIRQISFDVTVLFGID